MIHTKEPANKVFVFVTAYRGYESLEVNEKVLKGLVRTIKTYPGAYGNIRDENVQGCFKEAGMPEAMQERTLKVECTTKQAAELAWQMGPGLAIQQGKPLPIDNYLQGRLMG